MTASPLCSIAIPSEGTHGVPCSYMAAAEAATVASPTAAGAAAAGPMTGDRKPKMPAKVCDADAMMLLKMLAKFAAELTVEPATSAVVRAVTPAVVAAVCAS